MFQNDADFDVEIVMDQDIAHAGNSFPGNVRVLFPQFLGKIFDCLPDNLQVAHHGVLCLRIREKRIVAFGYVQKDSICTVADVQKIGAVIPHSGVASARMRSWR